MSDVEKCVFVWIEKEFEVDEIFIECDFVMVMVVGEGMNSIVGIVVKVIEVFVCVEVNFEMIN